MNANSLMKKTFVVSAGYLFAGAVSLALPATSHASNLEQLAQGRIAEHDGEGKCGEGKCGGDKKPKPSPTPKGEGKCGEGKCGSGK